MKLLEQWQKDKPPGKLGFGLGIPFLVGALRQWPEKPLGPDSDGKAQIRALLISIRDDAPPGASARLSGCGKLGEPVLAMVSGSDGSIAVPSPKHGEITFYVDSDSITNDGDFIEKLTAYLWGQYEAQIRAGNFSKRNGVFQPFDPNEIAMIQRAIRRTESDDESENW